MSAAVDAEIVCNHCEREPCVCAESRALVRIVVASQPRRDVMPGWPDGDEESPVGAA